MLVPELGGVSWEGETVEAPTFRRPRAEFLSPAAGRHAGSGARRGVPQREHCRGTQVPAAQSRVCTPFGSSSLPQAPCTPAQKRRRLYPRTPRCLRRTRQHGGTSSRRCGRLRGSAKCPRRACVGRWARWRMLTRESCVARSCAVCLERPPGSSCGAQQICTGKTNTKVTRSNLDPSDSDRSRCGLSPLSCAWLRISGPGKLAEAPRFRRNVQHCAYMSGGRTVNLA